jgi:hypothetical protein
MAYKGLTDEEKAFLIRIGQITQETPQPKAPPTKKDEE